ncbi:MAG: DoxX family protein [Xanthobacteraceae bacterium]
MSVTSVGTPARYKTVGWWTLKIVVAALFIAAAAAKLAGAQRMVDEFSQIGLGQWFRYFTGVTEMMAGILLLVPATTAYAAAYLALVCICALIAQVFVLHDDVIHAIVLAVILGFISWNSRRVRAPRSHTE